MSCACVKLREQSVMIVVSGWRDDAMLAFLLGWPHPYIMNNAETEKQQKRGLHFLHYSDGDIAEKEA